MRSVDASSIHWINTEELIVYDKWCSHILQTEAEFNKVILQAKRSISERTPVLDRFEFWEVRDLRMLRSLLIGRCRNQEEKTIVAQYMRHMETGES